jgi:hypothetical protein
VVHAAVPTRDVFVTTFLASAVEERQKSGKVTIRGNGPRQLAWLLRLSLSPHGRQSPVSVLERLRHLQRDPATV